MQKFIHHFLHEYEKSDIKNVCVLSLICYALRNIDDPRINKIRSSIADKLIEKRKSPLQWNYDDSGNYPDDIDDTFLALIALYFERPEYITGEVMLEMTSLLLEQEVKTGGPYRTWIYDGWDDIDTVVNSNVTYFLSLHNIHLEPLQYYIENSFESKYYIHPLVKYYFISRICQDKNLIEKIKEIPCENILHSALKSISLNNLGEELTIDENQPFGYEFYLDSDGYNGSPALTYALCLEALSCKKPNNFDSITQKGWNAYSIFDDIVDGDLPNEFLYEGLQFLAELFLEFNPQQHREILRKIFKKMHTASTWEIQHCRNIDKLPRFHKFKHHSGYKSIGMVISTLITSNLPKKKILNFYREFLELKQLNDDAHDWKEDLEREHITHANIGVARYMKKGGEDIDDFYWKHNILNIIKRYRMHITRLDKMNLPLLKKEIDGFKRILYTLERERDYFLYKNKS